MIKNYDFWFSSPVIGLPFITIDLWFDGQNWKHRFPSWYYLHLRELAGNSIRAIILQGKVLTKGGIVYDS